MLPACLLGDAEGNDDFYYNEEEVLAGAGADQRARTLENLDSMLTLEDGSDDEEDMADGNVEVKPDFSCQVRERYFSSRPVCCAHQQLPVCARVYPDGAICLLQP